MVVSELVFELLPLKGKFKGNFVPALEFSHFINSTCIVLHLTIV